MAISKIMNLEDIKKEENFIRDNLYKDEYAQHAMNVDPYYKLIKITEDTWNYICLNILQIKKDSTLYFPNSRIELRKKITRSWDDIVKLATNNKIKHYFGDNADNVFIAGGSALATLLTVRYQDIDYFSTKEIMPHEINSRYTNFEVTPQIINFGYKTQLIKRLYKSPHEIVHSFDIDCCAILIDRHGNIYCSMRFLYALINGYNTVDFNYFSPSYEWRLIKYSTRGFSVYVPGVVNCGDPDLLYNKTEHGVCIPDSIWSVADIDDMLHGPMLRALLMNAKGFQKLLIASVVSGCETNSLLDNTSERSMKYSRRREMQSDSLTKLVSKQLSDYEEPVGQGNSINGIIQIGDDFYILDGLITYDNNGVPIVYKGSLVKERTTPKPLNNGNKKTYINNNSYQGTERYESQIYNKIGGYGSSLRRERPSNKRQVTHDNNDKKRFSPELETKILNILLSPYKKVNPGEQTTSTFHKIILDDNNEWYKLDKINLFEKSLYTLLYFNKIHAPPDLYDEKVLWFGSESINLLIYHIARLVLNNRIYDKFNGFEVTQLKISYGEYITKSIIYNNKEYPLDKGNQKEIINVLLLIGLENNILSNDEINILNALYIRVSDKGTPRVEKRHSVN